MKNVLDRYKIDTAIYIDDLVLPAPLPYGHVTPPVVVSATSVGGSVEPGPWDLGF